MPWKLSVPIEREMLRLREVVQVLFLPEQLVTLVGEAMKPQKTLLSEAPPTLYYLELGFQEA